MPNNEQARNKLEKQTNIIYEKDRIQSVKLLLIGLGIATGISLIWMLLVQFLSKFIVWVALGMAVLLLLITSIVFLVHNSTKLKDSQGWAIFLAILGLIIAFLIVFYVIVHRRRINICGAFLKHSTTMLKENWKTFLYIPIFMVLTFIFGILTVFEYIAFSSYSQPTFDPQHSLYLELNKSWVLIVLLAIQTLWGLSFLRDTCTHKSII